MNVLFIVSYSGNKSDGAFRELVYIEDGESVVVAFDTWLTNIMKTYSEKFNDKLVITFCNYFKD